MIHVQLKGQLKPSEALFKKVFLLAAVNKSVDFRSLHQRRGLRLLGGAAGFHDSQGPRGLSLRL